MTNNLPEPDDAPWLNLTPQEVEELRYNKQELTEYGKQRLRALMKEWDSQNVDAELLVDGFNDAIQKMKEMLR